MLRLWRNKVFWAPYYIHHLFTTATLDPLQFAYLPNRCTDDAIAHLVILTHTDSRKRANIRLSFVDFRPVFNTIIPSRLLTRLSSLGLQPSCASGSSISYPADSRLSKWASMCHPPSSSTPGPPRAACWALWCTPFTSLTVWQHQIPTRWSNSYTTHLWRVWSQITTNPHTSLRLTFWTGVRTTTWS